MKRKSKKRQKDKCGDAFKFGITTDYYCAGYIMPQGLMLDFCERNTPWKTEHPPEYLMKYWIKSKEERTQLVGKRMYDHQEIVLAFGKGIEAQQIDTSTPFQKSCDAVRFSIYETTGAEVMMVESQNKPTEEQIKTIQNAVRDTMPDKLLMYGPRSGDCWETKYGPRLMDVRNWINKCWRDE